MALGRRQCAATRLSPDCRRTRAAALDFHWRRGAGVDAGMSLFDFINAAFELGSGFVMLLNCRSLYRAKELKGYSIWATVFFTIWGFWNMIWYPSFGAWASFAGGLGIVAANLLWIGLALRYRRPLLLERPLCDHGFEDWDNCPTCCH
jgi:hypothetical protein